MRSMLAVITTFVMLATACSGDDGDDGAGGAVAPTIDAPGSDETTAAPAEDEPSESVEVLAINLLHGLFCPEETDFCDAPNRLALLFRMIEEAGCPDVVGLTEIGPRQTELVPAELPSLCDGRYTLYYDGEAQGQNLDQEMVLTSLTVVDDSYVELANFPWGAHWIQADAPIGTIDFVMTHQASSANNPPCTTEICPSICVEGEETGTCQSRELLAFFDERAAPDGIQILGGDLNQPPDHPRITLYGDGGFVDAWLEAGQPECDPATGAGCTCCVDDGGDGSGLRNADQRHDERIDYVLVRNRSGCELEYETEVFSGEAAAEPLAGIVWPSDHAGILTRLTCR